jgi:hypothetical protein
MGVCLQKKNRKKNRSPPKQADRVASKASGEKKPPRPALADRVAPKPTGEKKPLRPALVAALLFLVCLACYLANGRTEPAVKSFDTLPNRILPFSALAFHTITLDPFAVELAPYGGKLFVQRRRGHLVSFYPIGPALVALPIYLPAWAWLSASGRATAADLFAVTPVMEKVSASMIAALTVVFIYLTLRRWISARAAFLASVGLGLGTSMWATASQLLWQHGPVALGIAAGVFFLTTPQRSILSVSLAGLAYSLAVASRPTAAVFWMAAIGALLLEPRPLRQRFVSAAWFAAAGMPFVLFCFAYNVYWYSTPLGGYSGVPDDLAWHYVPKGIVGLLLSANRGLFIFMPITLLGIIGLLRSFRRLRKEPLLPMLAIAATFHFLLFSGYRYWHGGWAFGPRYLVDILPILALGAGLELPRLGRGASAALAIAFVWSVLVQWNGAFCYPASQWDARMDHITEKAVWNWDQFELWQDFQQWRRWPVWAAPY